MPAGYTQQYPQSYSQQHSPTTYSHSRSRTGSSNVFPTINYPPEQQYSPNMQANFYSSRRTPSTGTFSTVASSGNGPVQFRQTSQDLSRSGSARSGGGSPLSYVALMRKQKATVWCDRAQPEDPRILQQKKAAKMKANMTVVGAPGRSSTSGSGGLAGSNRVTAKIRHGGKAGLVGYSPGELVGGVGGVPMRLSASEVEGEDSDDDADSARMLQNHHQRTGSGRSSIGSGRRGLTYSRQSNAGSTAGRFSSGNSPPDSLSDLMEAGETPVPGDRQNTAGYFAGEGGIDGTRSAGSGSSGERADNVAELDTTSAARLASNKLFTATVTREKSLRNPEDLRRRGSVDERTATMSHARLFIANPDTDSD